MSKIKLKQFQDDKSEIILPLGTPGGSVGAKKPPLPSSELPQPALPKELPECRNSWGTAGGATFLAVAAGLGGLDMPPTENKRKNILVFVVLYHYVFIFYLTKFSSFSRTFIIINVFTKILNMTKKDVHSFLNTPRIYTMSLSVVKASFTLIYCRMLCHFGFCLHQKCLMLV